MNIASLSSSSYVLAPGYLLRRATPEEIDIIKNKLDGLGLIMNPWIPLLFERRLPLAGIVEALPQNEWRYFVIGFEDNGSRMDDLQRLSAMQAMRISSPNFLA
jgi:hypothetical protein